MAKKVVPNEELSLPMLYKLDSQGIVRVWRTWTILQEDGTAIENNESGIEGGKLSGIPITITSGKNLGKKNEVTPLQVANTRILSKFDKKVREGYVRDLSEFTHKGVMKAMNYRGAAHRMSKSVLYQPKLDGIRCKCIQGSEFKMTTKTNNGFKDFIYELDWAKRLREELLENAETDGELYCHGLELNEISRLVDSYKFTTAEFVGYCEDVEEGLLVKLKKKQIGDQVYTGGFYPSINSNTNEWVGYEPIEVGRNKGWIFPGVTLDDVELVGTTQLEYWIFDLPDEDSSAEIRNFNLIELSETLSDVNGLRFVIGEEGDVDDLEEVNTKYLEQGFEGTMLRNPSCKYAFGEVSPGLMKYKLYFDAEWEIVGYNIDREGNPTFICTSDTGRDFEVRPTGNRAWRAKVLRDMDSIIGKRTTIRYQKLYPDTLIPQFARALAIRDYE